MAIPRKKRRIRLLIILSRLDEEYGVKLLSMLWYVYDKIANSETLTTEEESAAAAVDSFYAAYNPTDSDTFNDLTCSDISGEVKGVKMDALETAVQSL